MFLEDEGSICSEDSDSESRTQPAARSAVWEDEEDEQEEE